jgi:hypothetical protein
VNSGNLRIPVSTLPAKGPIFGYIADFEGVVASILSRCRAEENGIPPTAGRAPRRQRVGGLQKKAGVQLRENEGWRKVWTCRWRQRGKVDEAWASVTDTQKCHRAATAEVASCRREGRRSDGLMCPRTQRCGCCGQSQQIRREGGGPTNPQIRREAAQQRCDG